MVAQGFIVFSVWNLSVRHRLGLFLCLSAHVQLCVLGLTRSFPVLRVLNKMILRVLVFVISTFWP
jgi:hypothetical protein